MQKKALELAAKAMSEVNGVKVEPNECYIVWFCKTLQNWKALVSTNKLTSYNGDADYCEVTCNGDKQVVYVDVYKKERNIQYAI